MLNLQSKSILFKICMCMFICAWACYCNEIDSKINSYFLSLDSLLWSISVWPRMRTQDVKPIDIFFLEQIKKQPSFETLMRANSKGKVVNEVIGRRVTERNFRDIQKQQWFKKISQTLEPYYGNFNRKGAGYFLFWGKPISIRTKSGFRFGGAVAAKIDLLNCFREISNIHNVNFQIIHRRKIIFSNLKTSTRPLKKTKLYINGMSGLYVRYETDQPQEQDIVSNNSDVSTNSTGFKEAVLADSLRAGFKDSSKISKLKLNQNENIIDRRFSTPLLIIFIVILVLAVVIFISIINQTAKRKKMLTDIDKGLF